MPGSLEKASPRIVNEIAVVREAPDVHHEAADR